MISSAFLLGQSAQVTVEKTEYWLVSLAVAGTFVALLALLGAWAMLRRQPPIEREIDDRIGSALKPVESRWEERHRELHEEMLRLDAARSSTVASIFQKLDDTRKESKDDYGQLRESLQRSFNELNFSIGKLEGTLAKQ